MIVVKLMGGLGNQLFQYAAGKALALQHNVPLYLDDSFLKQKSEGHYTQRNFELDQLNINYQLANEKIKNCFKPSLWKSMFKAKPSLLNDTHHFNPDFFHTGNSVYLNGFWQTEHYFKAIRSTLLKELTPSYNFSEEELNWIHKVKDCHSIALHVRRGDYVSHKEANSFHGVCDLAYYEKAIQYLEDKINDPVFFIFSDDINWCRENFKDLSGSVFVDNSSVHSSFDLFLMSYCEHAVIANSSYSWWGAWLNQNENKLVIAPKKWFNDPNFNPDIYSENWLKL